ncbi:uncharacterized protein LOC117096895 isoform X2 [Trachypithecus francoisi]|uniref:uncharacterized protein LOC117096895 isoform X2 n=1 Tax=Trachypithecus francoisi TaxID=54180 RepID=UPI00141B2F29|nr:uncharacterized protein LOC117096895 isoform X2 [Trachypithecus francoisi]
MGACSPAFLSGLDVVREVCVVAAGGGAVASHCPRGAEWQRAGTQRGYGPLAHSWRTAMKVDLTGARPLNPADPASCGPREGPCWAGPRPGMPLPSPGIGERRASGGRWQCSDERPATHEGALGAAPALTAESPHSETQTLASGLKRGTVFQTVSGEVAGGCLAPLPLVSNRPWTSAYRIRYAYQCRSPAPFSTFLVHEERGPGCWILVVLYQRDHHCLCAQGHSGGTIYCPVLKGVPPTSGQTFVWPAKGRTETDHGLHI